MEEIEEVEELKLSAPEKLDDAKKELEKLHFKYDVAKSSGKDLTENEEFKKNYSKKIC